MHKKIETGVWMDQAERIFELIQKEMQNVSAESLPQAYPKFVIMYEFFRMLRGEAFVDSRPLGLGDAQRKLYAMEDELAKQLLQIRQSLDMTNERNKFYIDEAKKIFDLSK